jgi:hypothetical protein
MTPKEKANELVDKMHEWFIDYGQAKGCALIAVDLLITEMYAYDSSYCDNYYFEVKQEIEKL